MKALSLIILVLISISFANRVVASDNMPDDISSKITEAIKKGDASLLSVYFNSTIDLKMPGHESTFSKAQAKLLMKDFFEKNPPLKFIVKQQGESNDGARFTIGKYHTTNNKVFRTYFLVKKKSGKLLIHLLQFEMD